MSKAYVFLATGFEETEAIAAIDILRRGHVDVTVVSVSDSLQVIGRSRLTVTADCMFGDAEKLLGEADMLVLPGGQPGVTYLSRHKGLKKALEKAAKEKKRRMYASGRFVAAICAAPTVLGQLGLLKGKRATVYPGLESELSGAEVDLEHEVVTDGNITTSRGVGTAVRFGLALVEILSGRSVAQEIRQEIVYDVH